MSIGAREVPELPIGTRRAGARSGSLTPVDQPAARDLTVREREVLDALLAAGLPDAERLRSQVPRLTVAGVCGCGCPTILFAHDAKGEGIEIVADARVAGTDDAALLFVNARGDLDSLEYVWVSESPPSEFPPVSAIEPRAR